MQIMSLVWMPFLVTVTVFFWALSRPDSSSVQSFVCVRYMLVGGLAISIAVFLLAVVLTLSLNASQLPLMFIYLLPMFFAFGEIAGAIKYFTSN